MNIEQMNNNTKSNNNGFTLVEIIVVIVILAIIAAIVVPVTLSIIDSSKNDNAKRVAKNIMNAVQTEFNQLAVNNEVWYSIENKIGIILNKDRKNRDTASFTYGRNEFKNGFIDISNTIPVDNIMNKVENADEIEILYVGAGNAYRYEYLTGENDKPSDRKKMYMAYAIVFKLKDDDNIYFYDGKEVSTKWPFSTPGYSDNDFKNDSNKDDSVGQNFYLNSDPDTQLQLYSLRPINNVNCGNEYWKKFILPKVRKAQ